MSRNLISGTDWLCQYGVWICHDLGCMKIGNKRYDNLEEDILILSVARSKHNTMLKPKFCNYRVCKGQIEIRLSGQR